MPHRLAPDSRSEGLGRRSAPALAALLLAVAPGSPGVRRWQRAVPGAAPRLAQAAGTPGRPPGHASEARSPAWRARSSGSPPPAGAEVVTLIPPLTVTGATRASLADIGPGTYLGTAARAQPDGTLPRARGPHLRRVHAGHGRGPSAHGGAGHDDDQRERRRPRAAGRWPAPHPQAQGRRDPGPGAARRADRAVRPRGPDVSSCRAPASWCSAPSGPLTAPSAPRGSRSAWTARACPCEPRLRMICYRR